MTAPLPPIAPAFGVAMPEPLLRAVRRLETGAAPLARAFRLATGTAPGVEPAPTGAGA